MISIEHKTLRELIGTHEDKEGNLIKEYKVTLEYDVFNVTGAKWRLVHNGEKVLALIEGTEKSVTSTMHDVEELDTKQKALDRIEALDLVSIENINEIA